MMTHHIDPENIYKSDPKEFLMSPEELKELEKVPFLASLHILFGDFTLEDWKRMQNQKDY